MRLIGLKSAPLADVCVTDEYIVNSFKKEVKYLTSFDTDRLLAGFRETAGLDMHGSERYDGWERLMIGGHTMGHYMTACVQAFESGNSTAEDRTALIVILESLITGLKECQDALGTGFIFGAELKDKNIPEAQFDLVEQGKGDIFKESWVPWYTMHKVIEGLVEASCLTSDDPFFTERAERLASAARDIVSRLGDWVYSRTSSWDEQTHRTVLNIEYGGMNDCMCDVYMLTGKKEHLEAAHAFDDIELFERIYNAEAGDDALNNMHANTTIPKFIGAAKRCLVTGETIFRDYAAGFWELVEELHTYDTGDNSEWEHFGRDGILDAERTNANCETCNAYNMLKLSKLLFELTGDGRYIDRYQATYLNTILSSQNPESGMTTYFQPMATGYFKVYSTPFTKFWCCTGSGMENFSKPGDCAVLVRNELVAISRYVSMRYTGRETTLTVECDLPLSDSCSVTFNKPYQGTLALRLPEWLASEAEVTVDGAEYSYAIAGRDRNSNGYALIAGPFDIGCRVGIRLPMSVSAHALPDGPHTYAFMYGPALLSAGLGREDMATGITGVDVTIPERSILARPYLIHGDESIRVNAGTVEEFISGISEHMIRTEQNGRPAFRLADTDAELVFTEHYRRYDERYGIYFKFFDQDAELADAEENTYFDETAAEEILQAEAEAETVTVQAETETEAEIPAVPEAETEAETPAVPETAIVPVSVTEEETEAETVTEPATETEAEAETSAVIRTAIVPVSVTEEETEAEAVTEPATETEAEAETQAVAETAIVPVTVTEEETEAEAVTEPATETETEAETGTEAESGNTYDDRIIRAYEDERGVAPCITDMTCAGGSVLYSRSRNRYLVRLGDNGNIRTSERIDAAERMIALGYSVPKGCFAETDGIPTDGDRLLLRIGRGRYSGHRIRIFNGDCSEHRDYDLVVDRLASANDAAGEAPAEQGHDRPADAYASVRGSFAGELCYLFDHSPEERTTCGTYNSSAEQMYGADPATGYLWGTAGDEYDRRYIFELEDGNYELKILFTAPEWTNCRPTLYLDKDTDREKILEADVPVTTEPRSYRVRVSGGRLELAIVSDDGSVAAWRIEIRAQQTIALPSDYVMISGEMPAVEEKPDIRETIEDTRSFVARMQAKALYYEELENRRRDEEEEASFTLKVRPESEPEPESVEESEEESVPISEPEPEEEPVLISEPEPKSEPEAEPVPISEPEPEPELEPEFVEESEEEPVLISEPEPKSGPEPEEESATEEEIKTEKKPEPADPSWEENARAAARYAALEKACEKTDKGKKVLGGIAGVLAIAGSLYAIFHKKD